VSRVRVLHVIGRMNRGGVETWLMQLLRTVDRERLELHFAVTKPERGHYDDEIRELGARIFPCPGASGPFEFGRRFLAVLRDEGPWDVVHSHLHHYSGLVLALARRAGVGIRVAHSHTDSSREDARASAARALYLRLTEAAIRRWATHGLAASDAAARALFGPAWREDPRFRVSHCGLDFRAFRAPLDRDATRRELGIPADALVIGHVGRFDPVKNHAFLLRVAAAVLRDEPRAFVVLVGDGELRPAIEAEADRLGIRARAVFPGLRSDVARLLRAFDVFLFPSLHEGLPLVGLEAQAAGLPIVLSDTITPELAVVPELFTWRSLSEPPQAWAASVLAAASAHGRVPDPLGALERSDFSVFHSLRALEATYGAAQA
jgi:glycosyltransferase involved in cell wall biosynthesis